MKKHKRKNLTQKVTLLAGATATAMLAVHAPQAHADVAGDALINKLEQKGILTSAEAKKLLSENQKEYSNSFSKEFNKITGTPDWVKSYKFYGDFRGRYDYMGSDYTVDRGRFRYRLRAGLTVNINDNFQVGFRLASGGPDPLSNNQTLGDISSKKPVSIDAAYAKWTAINDGSWLVSATIGKMDNPFHFTPMVFDPDLTPEGGAIQGKYTINDKNNITFTGAAFVLGQVSSTTHDPFLYGGQVAWNSKLSDKLASSVGVGGFQIVSPGSLTTQNVGGKIYNYGNTVDAAGAPVHNFNPVIADASLTYTLDSFPLYHGKFPIKVAGEFINNPGAPNNNDGYWAGITFGKAGKAHNWSVSYRYEYLESDAWYAQIVNDDNVAYDPATGGIAGGTNIKGHLVKASYNLTDAVSLAFTCYINNEILNPVPGKNTSAIHAMADIMWKF